MKVRIVNEITGEFGLVDALDNTSGATDNGKFILTGTDGKIDSSFLPSALSSNVILDNVDCLASVYVGAAVRMNALGVAVNALADSFDNSNVIGIVESKASATKCTIRVNGVTAALYSSLDPTKTYFLSDTAPGGIDTVVPSTSGHVRLRIGQPFTSDKLLVDRGERVVRS